MTEPWDGAPVDAAAENLSPPAADETTIDNQSPTVIFTAPDAVDMHTSPSDSSLWMYNSGTDRWLVTISVRRTPL